MYLKVPTLPISAYFLSLLIAVKLAFHFNTSKVINNANF
ncbi:hypothetical protein AOR13_610 [Alteromonas stellipolaris LMG 21856]|nr:hypothetical protein AOR13_610 [Alteromonas stellipolaris LMG 21856]